MTSTSLPFATRAADPAHTHWRAYLALGFGVLCISWSAILARWADIPGASSAFYRVLIASAVLIPLWALRRRQTALRGPGAASAAPGPAPGRTGATRVPAAAIWIGILGGVLFAGDLGMYNSSIMLTSATNATLLGNNAPLWVALGAWLFFRERLTMRYWIGLGIALAGTIAIVGSDVFRHPSFGLGDVLSCAAAVCFGGYLLTVERVRSTMDTLTLTVLTVTASTVTLFVIALLLHVPLHGFTATTWSALVALGLVAQVGGYLALTYALGHLPATVTSVCLLLQAPLTALLAVPLLGESVSMPQILGGALVLSGVYLVNRPNAT